MKDYPLEKCVVITRGLHPPWNIGEYVATLYFLSVLNKLYRSVIVLSTIDIERLSTNIISDDLLLLNESMKIVWQCTLNRKLCAKKLSSIIEDATDIYLINISVYDKLISLLYKKLRKPRTRIYFISYGAFATPLSTYLRHVLGNIVNSLLLKNIVTLSPLEYKYLKNLRVPVLYVPMPIPIELVPEDLVTAKKFDCIRILYHGHIDPYRFPYPIIFSALKKAYERIKRYIGNLDFRFSIVAPPISPNYNIGNYRTDPYKYLNRLHRYSKVLEGFLDVEIEVRYLSIRERFAELAYNTTLFLFCPLKPRAIDPPLSLLEAMSTRNCIIATNVQSIPTLLTCNRGVVIPVENFYNLSKRLIDALSYIFMDPYRQSEYALNAYKYIRKIHFSDAVAKYLLNYLLRT